MGVINMAAVVVLLLGLAWLGWYLVKRFWPSAATTTAGQTIDKAVDKTQDWSAMAVLRMIRFMDEVEGNPKALDAWEVLYKAIGGTPYSPDTPTLGTTSTIPAASLTPPTSAVTGGKEHVVFE